MSEGGEERSGRRVVRGVFVVYGVALAVATHWPALELPSEQIPRPDLVAHVGVFGAWAFLLAWGGWFGARHSARNLLMAMLVALAYAAIDEATQGIPIVRRQARWDDFAANVLGVAAGSAAALIVAALEVDRSET